MKHGVKSERHERIMDLTIEIEGNMGTLEEALDTFTCTEELTLRQSCSSMRRKGVGFVFSHYEAWEVLKNHHKWHGAKAVVPERRFRMTDEVEETNKLFRDDTKPRPHGKSKYSKSQISTLLNRRYHSRRVRKLSMIWFMKSYAKNVLNFLDFIATQQKFEELKFLNFNTDGMTPRDAVDIGKLKNQIRATYFTEL
nr:ubiquitin carboxyl-terminal hydrolase 17-like [Tanacetum cinerariifolium]